VAFRRTHRDQSHGDGVSRVLYKGLVHEVCVDRRDTWCGVCYADWYTELWKIATTDSVTCLACLATVAPTSGRVVTAMPLVPGLGAGMCVVTNDPDPRKNGTWVYNGKNWRRAK